MDKAEYLFEKIASIPDSVIQLVANKYNVEANKIRPNSRFLQLGDELDIVELGAEAEKKFNIHISDKDFNKLKTVNHLSKLVKNKHA